MANEHVSRFFQIVSKDVGARIQALLKEEGVQYKKGGTDIENTPYFRASRYVVRGMISSAIQTLFESGASPSFVSTQINTSVAEGWELFLKNNPDVAAKIEAEKKAKAAQAQFHVVPDLDGDDDEDEEGSDGEFECCNCQDDDEGCDVCTDEKDET